MVKRSDREYVNRVNGEKIRVEDLRAVIEAAAALPKRRRSLEAMIGLAVEVLPKASPAYRVALMFRVEALGHLIESGDVPGFTRKGGEAGLSLLSDGAIAAAAKCTLYPDDHNRVIFHRDEFSLEALKAAAIEGRS
jgi:hypothetical protein